MAIAGARARSRLATRRAELPDRPEYWDHPWNRQSVSDGAARGALRGFVAIYRALRMKRRWPTLRYREYLDWSLAEIRREFRIRLV